MAASQGILSSLLTRREIREFLLHGGEAGAQNEASKMKECVLGIKGVFLDFDAKLRLTGIGRESGSTATIALVTPSHVFVANCGDSRAMLLFRNGDVHTTRDHKPTDQGEMERI